MPTSGFSRWGRSLLNPELRMEGLFPHREIWVLAQKKGEWCWADQNSYHSAFCGWLSKKTKEGAGPASLETFSEPQVGTKWQTKKLPPKQKEQVALCVRVRVLIPGLPLLKEKTLRKLLTALGPFPHHLLQLPGPDPSHKGFQEQSSP